jgi:hypothetical protein
MQAIAAPYAVPLKVAEYEFEVSPEQKIKPQLKPLIWGVAGTARDTPNQGFSVFYPVRKSENHEITFLNVRNQVSLIHN